MTKENAAIRGPTASEPSGLGGGLGKDKVWLGKPSGEGNGNPLQCSCLENPGDGGAWWAAVSGVAQSRTRLKRLSSSSSSNSSRTWKQPRCPSTDEWIRKLWYTYTMEYYSTIKKNTCESILMRWMKLEPITQSEVSQKVKHQYSILTHIYGV